MTSRNLIPIEAGDSSTHPNALPGTIVPLDTDAQLDADMGFILDLQKRNEELEEEAALSGQIVVVGSSSSYGPAPSQPSRTMGYRQKYDLGPKEDDISPFKPNVRSFPVGAPSPEKAQLRKAFGDLKRALQFTQARSQGEVTEVKQEYSAEARTALQEQATTLNFQAGQRET